MKAVLTVLGIIPFILCAQISKNSANTLPLLESIISDTVNENFNQVSFLYDDYKKVISIINKEVKIHSKPSKKIVEKIIKEQLFEYKGANTIPYARKIYSYKDLSFDTTVNPRLILESIEHQYFLEENGNIVGDSSMYFYNHLDGLDWNWEKDEPQKRISKLEQTPNSIYHELDLTKPYSPPTTLTNELKLTPVNISKVISRYRYANRGNDATFYTYSRYDGMLNPLKQLNIAMYLINEKISLGSGGQYGKTDINWYFFNQNNCTNYFVTTDEQSSHYKDMNTISYTYNRFKQPVLAKVRIKKIYANGGALAAKYQQSFTFRYKK
ncbi:MAG: hypothetical protein CUR34_08920 [Sediminibacterium sp.]|nr:MAG: hypothetical protein CUR34_08920 [Sediminibacterium sp.] [Sediminibacterium sp. FEMGT703S]